MCVKTQTGGVLTAAGIYFFGERFLFFLFWSGGVSSYGGGHFPSDSELLFHPHLLVPVPVCVCVCVGFRV